MNSHSHSTYTDTNTVEDSSELDLASGFLRDMGYDEPVVHVTITAESRNALSSMLPNVSPEAIDNALRVCGGDTNAAAMRLFEEEEARGSCNNSENDRTWYPSAETWTGILNFERDGGAWQPVGQDPTEGDLAERGVSTTYARSNRREDLGVGARVGGHKNARGYGNGPTSYNDRLDPELNAVRDKQQNMSPSLVEAQRLHKEANALFFEFKGLLTARGAAKSAGDAKEYNRQASEVLKQSDGKRELANRAFRLAYNPSSTSKKLTVCDLHGQFVEDAIKQVFTLLHSLPGTDASSLRIITGRGVHSTGGKAKLAPAIREYLRSENIKFSDEVDGGSLTVSFV